MEEGSRINNKSDTKYGGREVERKAKNALSKEKKNSLGEETDVGNFPIPLAII
jgi:hypothetical protein